MNGIQKYLIAVAIESLHDAAGKLVSSGELDTTTITMSLNELISEIKTLEVNVRSKISCNVDYRGGFERTRVRLIDPGVKPIFIQPLPKGQA